MAKLRARDEYVSHVPPEKDPTNEKGVKNSTLYQFDVADIYRHVARSPCVAFPRQPEDEHCFIMEATIARDATKPLGC